MIARFHDDTMEEPSEYEEMIVAKLIYASYDELIDTLELDYKDVRQKKAEIIVRRGITSAADGATCPCCLNEYCEQKDDPGQFEFFKGFHENSSCGQFH